MKLNNKGFTVVELLASFTLTMVIVVLLFEIVVELKDVYVSNALKAKILDNNALVATHLNNKLSSMDILGAHTDFADDTCKFRYNQGGIEKVYVITVSDDNRTMTFGDAEPGSPVDLKVTYPEGAEIKNPSFKQVYGFDAPNNQDNSYIKLSYVVSSDYLDKDITFNYVFSYHQNQYWNNQDYNF